jgi:hypothetical protein
VNSESLVNLRVHDKLIDSKLEKCQHAKKMQQQLLQKIISTPAATAAPSSSTASSKPVKMAQPPLPPNPPPPLPPMPKSPTSSLAQSVAESSSTTKTESPEKPKPSNSSNTLLQLVKQSAKSPLKKAVQPSKLSQAKVNTQTRISNTTNMIELSSQMTLGAMVAATASSSSASSTTKVANKTSTTLLRPNLYTSETTNTKLEQLAAKSQEQANNSDTHQMSIMVNAKLVASGQHEPIKTDKHKTHFSLLTCLESIL